MCLPGVAPAVVTGNELSQESTALPKVGWIARLEGLPKDLTWPPAEASTEGLRWAPKELATGMGIPDKALVTETSLLGEKLGQQPSVGTSGPGTAARE